MRFILLLRKKKKNILGLNKKKKKIKMEMKNFSTMNFSPLFEAINSTMISASAPLSISPPFDHLQE